MSELLVTSIYNQEGEGAPSFPKGATSTGVITATSFSGSGANLTGIDATALKDSNGTVRVQANTTGAVITGNVSVGGTLTYEDVTNVDSIGVVTARSGVDITGASAGVNGASNLILKTGGSEKVRITSAGKVGIGDADPDEALHVYAAGGAIKVDSNGDSAVRWATSGTNKYSLYHNNSSNGLIFFDNTANAERLRIGSSGQIGLSGANYGTSGQVLTSGGGSAAPSWADAGGVWSLIDNNKVTTNVSAIDVSFGANAGITTSYAQIKVYYNIWLASGDKLYVRGGYGFNGNIAADIKTSDYWWSGYWHRAGDASMNVVTTGENAGYALISANNNKTQHSGEMIFDNSAGRMRVSGSASWPAMVYNTQGFSGGDNDAHNFTISGQLKGGDNSPMSGFRIYSGGPSIVSGEVRTYGLSAT